MQNPSLLVLLLIMIFLTSWIQLKLNIVTDVEATTFLANSSDRPQSFKEKIIRSQQKTIRKLKETLQDLQKQLELCRVKGLKNGTSVDDKTIHLTEVLNGNEHEW